jgi:hypothetical protein
MSSPQQPWSPGRPAPSDPPRPDGPPASGYGPPPAYGAPQGYGAPQTPGYGAPTPYGAQGYGPAPTPTPPPFGQQPQAYGGGPTGELVVNLRRPFGAMGMISPVLTIDGYAAGSTWGRNVFQVPAGVRRVDVAQSYLWTYGRASHPVNVEPGRTSEIFYSGPMATFGFGGAIGTEPQRRPGTGLFIGLMAFVFVILMIAVLTAAFAGS